MFCETHESKADERGGWGKELVFKMRWGEVFVKSVDEEAVMSKR